MRDSDPQSSGGREVFLTILFVVFTGGSLTLFLIFATGGFFAYVVGITLGLGLFGWFHYLLWGKRFDRDTRAERESMKAQEEEEAWNANHPTWERRF